MLSIYIIPLECHFNINMRENIVDIYIYISLNSNCNINITKGRGHCHIDIIIMAYKNIY